MNRTTAVETWREVCGSDMVMAMMPPTGRMLEEFARRIAAAEREACATWYAEKGWLLDEDDVADAMRKRDAL